MPPTRPPIRLGVVLPTAGPLPVERGVPRLARELEEAGAESVWVADHIVLPESSTSHYPFAADGRPTWAMDIPYFDALTALAAAAAVTERVALGTAVLVLPLRHPVVFAKQAASIDVMSGGRLRLGLGAGWLREEFEALNVPFERRGARLEEWMALARACWTGRPPAIDGEWYSLPAGTLCLPTPVNGSIPLLVGGHSPVALRRAGRIGDGWLGQQSLGELDPERLAAEIQTVRDAAGGRELDAVLRIVDSAGRADEVAAGLPALGDAGVGEVIVNVDWERNVAEQLAVMRGAAVGT